MPTLTKSFIDKLSPEKSDKIFWDGKLSGFGVKVTPKGRKVYILKYRTEDGRQRKPVIGVHGHITCEQAREIATGWLGERVKGNDPSQARQTKRQSPSIGELCDRYMEEHSKVHKKASSIALETLLIRKYVKPLLGSLKTLSVTQADISKLHIGLRSTPTLANRMLQTLSKMFNLAETWSLRPRHSNPVKGIQRYKEESRERFLSSEEISRLWTTLKEQEREGKESIYFLNMIRLLMLKPRDWHKKRSPTQWLKSGIAPE